MLAQVGLDPAATASGHTPSAETIRLLAEGGIARPSNMKALRRASGGGRSVRGSYSVT
jgi:hypothetical protein